MALSKIKNASLASDVSTGTVLQVKSATKTDKQSTTSSTYSDISGLSVTITPTSTTSKILVMVNIQYGGADNLYGAFQILRGSTYISQTTYASGNQTTAAFAGTMQSATHKLKTAAHHFLDSPATTSATTYKVQFASRYASYNFTINAPHQTDNQAYNIGGTSTITVMEIAG